MNQYLRIFFFYSLLLFTCNFSLAQLNSNNSGQILHDIKRLNTFCNVLYVAAHPDDENTRLLSYLANERHCRTAYLSLTRGDGGQNLIGREQGEDLGVIRTNELLAARATDGAEQLFTRAVDFGYSKNPEETFQIWGKNSILEDVVWVIRTFKPDIIITRFPEDGGGGHGHHTASAILAREAFKLSADPKAFPQQLKFTSLWQAQSLFWNTFSLSRVKESDRENLIQLDIGQYNPLLGKSYGEIAALSRSQHKSQGFGVANQRGDLIEYFQQWEGKEVKDIFEGISFGWERLNGSEKAALLSEKLYQKFNPDKPWQISKDLIIILKHIKELPDSHFKAQKIEQIKNLLLKVNALYLCFQSVNASLLRNEESDFTLTAINRGANNIALKNVKINIDNNSLEWDSNMPQNKLQEKKLALNIPSDISFTHHDWLRNQRTAYLYNIEDLQQRDKADSKPQIYAIFTLEIDGLAIDYSIPCTYKWVNPVRGELERRPEIIPNVVANGSPELLIFKDENKVSFKLNLVSNKDNASIQLKPIAAEGWKVIPAEVSLFFDKAKSLKTIDFEITAPSSSPQLTSILKFELKDKAVDFEPLHSIKTIDYQHLPMLTSVQEFSVKLIKANISNSKVRIGYIEGAGDDIPKALELLGYQVEKIDKQSVSLDQLQKMQAVITGVRAYNTNEDMHLIQPLLEQYVLKGGRLIVQYNTLNWLSALKANPVPYMLQVSRNRVTDEKAEVKILKPSHFLLNKPNKINQQDFENWVQERGLYFPDKWGDEFNALLSMNDPGDSASEGSLLIAPSGEGWFIYTGLSFFRQLPAGVPGAYRLFVNLLEGKP